MRQQGGDKSVSHRAVSVEPLPMVVTLGQHYNIGEKPTVILYTYINPRPSASHFSFVALYCSSVFVYVQVGGL